MTSDHAAGRMRLIPESLIYRGGWCQINSASLGKPDMNYHRVNAKNRPHLAQSARSDWPLWIGTRLASAHPQRQTGVIAGTAFNAPRCAQVRPGDFATWALSPSSIVVFVTCCCCRCCRNRKSSKAPIKWPLRPGDQGISYCSYYF